MKLEQGVAEFLASLAVERGLADATIRAYRRDLADYLSFLDGRSPDRDLIDGFVADLHGRGWVATTVARKIAAVRGLHRFLIAEDLAGADPSTMVDAPRPGARLPKALEIDETLKLIESPDSATPLGRRDRAILEFMYASGARVSEVVGLDLYDLDLDDRTAMVTGKGSRPRDC